MLQAPLEQFQILTLINLKLFNLDFSITNFLLINLITIVTFRSFIYFNSSNLNCLNETTMFFSTNSWQKFIESISKSFAFKNKKKIVNTCTNFTTYSYSLINESFVYFLLVFQSTYFLFFFATILLFFLSHYKNPFLKNFYNFFLSLPLKNQILLGMFTSIIAIPNKIWVNNNLSQSFVCFIYFLITICTIFTPIFFFILFLMFFTILQSYIFAHLYEKENSVFRKKLDSLIFLNDDKFSKDYLSFFWGNMWRAAVKKITPAAGGAGIAGILVGGYAEERVRISHEVSRDFEQYTNSVGTKFKTLEEAKKYKDSLREDILERDGNFYKLEKGIKESFKRLFDNGGDVS